MLVNPLNMHGPQFLVFYIAIGIITLLLIRYRMAQQESNWRMEKLNLTDPYEIAFLRGGGNEALKIAVLSLIDRGLLEISENNLKTKNQASFENVRRPIEKAILNLYASYGRVQEMNNDESLRSACLEYNESLQRSQLITSESVYQSRRPMLLLGILVLGGTAGAKIFVSFQRGHYNIIFLIILTVIFLLGLSYIYKKERTGLGDRVLTDLRILFKGLKDRGNSIKSGGESNELALLAAVFGVTALPSVSFPYIEKLFPKSKSSVSYITSNKGDSNGFSCGWSSFTCGGGSSCGGGGCGGGCGGCGGS